MEEHLKEKLGLKVLKSCQSLSGCINRGNVYDTENGKLFVKRHSGSDASVMFRGEYESLKKLSESGLVKVPEPLLVGDVGRESFIAMEYIDMGRLNKFESELGAMLGRLHAQNMTLLNEMGEEGRKNFVGFGEKNQQQPVVKFGFHVPTSCGYLPQNNEWVDDWVTFYARQKIQPQINMIMQAKGDREVGELWSGLQLKISDFFRGITVVPSLLHGDLWCGNAGETESGPVIFDPASFYGHHEYDLAIAVMFGGFGKKFFDSYHSIIKKEAGFDKRQELYLLFHNLNHWNHFGSHKNSSLRIMRNLLR